MSIPMSLAYTHSKIERPFGLFDPLEFLFLFSVFLDSLIMAFKNPGNISYRDVVSLHLVLLHTSANVSSLPPPSMPKQHHF